jgi:Double zinc ribbon
MPPGSPVQCPACGHLNRESARFCANCAEPLPQELACPRCGAANLRGQNFCDHCGSPLEERREAPAPDPRSYTPDHLAEKIRTAKGSLEGERKQVTVLFADVKGSMELGEGMDPEASDRSRGGHRHLPARQDDRDLQAATEPAKRHWRSGCPVLGIRLRALPAARALRTHRPAEDPDHTPRGPAPSRPSGVIRSRRTRDTWNGPGPESSGCSA